MCDAQREVGFSRAIQNLQETPRIPGGHNPAASGADMFELALKKLLRHFRLDQIINARAAATPRAFRQFNQFEMRNGTKNLAGLAGNFLPVTQVTGLVIRDGLRWSIRRLLWRRLDSDL